MGIRTKVSSRLKSIKEDQKARSASRKRKRERAKKKRGDLDKFFGRVNKMSFEKKRR